MNWMMTFGATGCGTGATVGGGRGVEVAGGGRGVQVGVDAGGLGVDVGAATNATAGAAALVGVDSALLVAVGRGCGVKVRVGVG